MQRSFAHLVREEKLFCKECSTVTPHKLYSRDPLINYDRVETDLRLLVVCQKCNANGIVFAGDFRTFVPERVEERGCKIPGRSRIEPGDRIFVTKHPSPVQVVQRTRVGDQYHLTVLFEDGERGVVDFIQKEPIREESVRTYKLLPSQMQYALIGDWVYHVERNVVGQVVGINRAGRGHVVIRLEGGNYILLRSGEHSGKIQNNRTLLDRVKQELQLVLSSDLSSLDISVTNGIIYVNGFLLSLVDRNRMIKVIESIEGVLAVVPFIVVDPVEAVSDEELVERIQRAIRKQSLSGLRGVRIQVHRGVAEISGDIRRDELQQELQELLLPIEGLRDLRFSLSKRTGFLGFN